jgi:hypothetical protein
MKMANELKYKLSLDLEDLKRDWSTLADRPREFGEQVEENRKKHEDATRQQRDEVSAVDAALKTMHKDADSMTLTTSEKVRGLINHYSEFRQSLMARGGGYELAGTLMPQQMMGMTDSISKIKGSVLSELPAGGLIGLMLLGGAKAEEMRAQTTEAMRMFSQAGHVASSEMKILGADAVALGLKLGKGPGGMMAEFGAMGSAFAAAGATIKEVSQHSFMGPLTGINESIGKTTIRIDSLYKLAAGTTAREAGMIMKNFGMDADGATEFIAKLGAAAVNTSQNVMAFTQSVMASGAALRAQRINISEVAEAQLKMQAAIANTIAPGASGADRQRWAGGYAEQGMQQITQGIAGMSMGMSAVLGEMMKRDNQMETKSSSPLEIMYRFQEGMAKDKVSGKESTFLSDAISQAVKLARQSAGPDEYAQRLFLEKTTGVGHAGSRGMLEIEKARESGSSSALDAAMKKNMGDLKSAFTDRAKETSDFQKALLEAQWGIAKIGMGLLGMVISGLASIVETIKWVYYSYLNKDPHNAQASYMMMEQYSKSSTGAQKVIGEGWSHLMKAGELAGVTTMNMPGVGGPKMSREQVLASLGGANPTGEGLIPSAKGVTKSAIGEAGAETAFTMLGMGEKNAVYEALRFYGLMDAEGKPTQKALASHKATAPQTVKDVSHKDVKVKPGQKLTVSIEDDASENKMAEHPAGRQ